MVCKCGKDMRVSDELAIRLICPDFGKPGIHELIFNGVIDGGVTFDFSIPPGEPEPTREVPIEEFMDIIKREGGRGEPH